MAKARQLADRARATAHSLFGAWIDEVIERP
jgi:hypothetical protein